MNLRKRNDLKVPQEAESIIERAQDLRAIQGKPQKTRRVFLIAATTAILIATAACKKNSTTPTTPTPPINEYPYGTYLGSFNGVDAFSNGYQGYASYEQNFIINNASTGMKWQCVEYAIRYYLQVYGYYLLPTIPGNANTFYSRASVAGLLSYRNGGSVPPQVGDIICSNGGSYGHVAIVREVGPNYINIIHQNWNNSPLDANETLSRNGNQVNDFISSYPIIGWLRMPSQAQ